MIMPDTCVRNSQTAIARRVTPAMAAGFLLLTATSLLAQAPSLPPVTVGGGVQTSFTHDDPDDGDSTDSFLLNSVRLYVNGSAADKVKFEFNTEYNGANNTVTVLDAVAKFEVSERFNVWAGRMLPPSDRANLYGPYFAHHWWAFTDGIQDGYPFVSAGRDNGAAYWGQFGTVKVQGGAFDGTSATGRPTLITAGRVMVDFWDPEPGYYLNGGYYGAKNLLAVGIAGQVQGSERSALTVDFLLERKAGNGGAFTIESEYANYSKLGGYNASYEQSDGAYILVAYLFPAKVGVGRFEALGKYAFAAFTEGVSVDDADYDQKTTEFNFSYIINDFKARVMFFYLDTRFNAVRENFKRVGVGVQLQM
jgi:hypothetical protein